MCKEGQANCIWHVKWFFWHYIYIYIYYHTGQPLHDVDQEDDENISWGQSETNSRGKGVGGRSKKNRSKGIRRRLQSDSENDSELDPWMEAQTSRKKPNTMDTEVVRISSTIPHAAYNLSILLCG